MASYDFLHFQEISYILLLIFFRLCSEEIFVELSQIKGNFHRNIRLSYTDNDMFGSPERLKRQYDGQHDHLILLVKEFQFLMNCEEWEAIGRNTSLRYHTWLFWHEGM